MKLVYFIEAFSQVIIGSILIFVSNIFIFPVLGIVASYEANAFLVIINTVIAFLKSYFVRYFFRLYERKYIESF